MRIILYSQDIVELREADFVEAESGDGFFAYKRPNGQQATIKIASRTELIQLPRYNPKLWKRGEQVKVKDSSESNANIIASECSKSSAPSSNPLGPSNNDQPQPENRKDLSDISTIVSPCNTGRDQANSLDSHNLFLSEVLDERRRLEDKVANLTSSLLEFQTKTENCLEKLLSKNSNLEDITDDVKEAKQQITRLENKTQEQFKLTEKINHEKFKQASDNFKNIEKFLKRIQER